jgi:uncharacterized protein (DUF983 family)
MKCPNCNNHISAFSPQRGKCAKCGADLDCNTFSILLILLVIWIFIMPVIGAMGSSGLGGAILIFLSGLLMYFLAVELFGKCKEVGRHDNNN